MAARSNATLRVVMHGFFLTSTNLFSGAATFLILHLSGLIPSILSVSLISVILCLSAYGAVCFLMKRIQPEILKVDSLNMGFFILLFSILLQPALIHPLMALLQGAGFNSPALFTELMLPVIINSACLLLNRFMFSESNLIS